MQQPNDKERLSLECSKCGLSFSSKKIFKKHKKENKYKCNICGKRFHTNNGLQKHMETEGEAHTRSTFRCEYQGCGKVFKFPDALSKHIHVTHKCNFFCNLCGKGFLTSNGLQMHMETLGETHRSYPCGYHKCDEVFFTTQTLYKHRRTHKTSKKMKVLQYCIECDKTLPDNISLKFHILKEHTNAYTGNGPYQCSLCDKSFPKSSILKKHLSQVHIGKGTHICTLCGSSFTKHRHLRKHQSDQNSNKRCFNIIRDLKRRKLPLPLVYNANNEKCSQGDTPVSRIKNSKGNKKMQSVNKPSTGVKVEQMDSEKSDTDNLSKPHPLYNIDLYGKPKIEVNEEQLESEKSDTNNLSEPNIEVKEEQMDNENNDNDNLSEPIIEEIQVKLEQMDSGIGDWCQGFLAP